MESAFAAEVDRLVSDGTFGEPEFPGPVFGPPGSGYEHVIMYSGPIRSDETGARSALPLGTTRIFSLALKHGSASAHSCWEPSDVQECVVSVVAGWKMESSIWAARPKGNDSRDFYDSQAVQRRAFDLDWQRLHKKPSVQQFLARVIGASGGCGAGGAAPSAEAVAQETAEIRDEVWQAWDAISQSFDFYAACSGGNGFQVQPPQS